MEFVTVGPAPRSILLDLWDKVRSNAIAMGVLLLGGSMLDDWKGRLLILALVGSVVTWVIGSLDRLFTQRLQVSEAGITYTSGLFERTRRELRWGEVASLHIVRTPASALFGTVTLTAVPAGSGEDGIIRVPGVLLGDADAAVSFAPAAPVPEPPAPPAPSAAPQPEQTVRATVGPWDCVRMTLASTGMLIAVPYILGLYQTAAEALGLQIRPGGHGWVGWLCAGAVTLLLAFAVAVARRMYAYLGWTVEVGAGSVAVTTGDFNTRRLTLRRGDVHVVTVRQPLTLRRRGELRVAVFGPASSELGTPPVLCPRLPARDLNAVLRAGGFPLTTAELTGITRQLRPTSTKGAGARTIALAALWCAPLVLFPAFRAAHGRGALVIAAAATLAAAVATMLARWSAATVVPTADPDLLVIASGAVSRRVHVSRRSEAFEVDAASLGKRALLTVRYQANSAKVLRCVTKLAVVKHELEWQIAKTHPTAARAES